MKQEIAKRLLAVSTGLAIYKDNNRGLVAGHSMWNQFIWIAPLEFEPGNEKGLNLSVAAREASRGASMQYQHTKKSILRLIEQSESIDDEFSESYAGKMDYFINQLSSEINEIDNDFNGHENLQLSLANVNSLQDKHKFFHDLGRFEYRLRLDISSAFEISCCLSESLQQSLELAAEQDIEFLADCDKVLDLLEQALASLNDAGQKYSDAKKNIQLELPGHKKALYEQVAQEFDIALEPMITKASELMQKSQNNSQYKNVSDTSIALIDELNQAKDALLVKGIGSIVRFEQRCMNAIKQAEPELSNHRGWAKIIVDFQFWLSAILTAGIVPLASRYLTQKASWNFFSVPKTSSEEVLNEVNQSMTALFTK